MQIFKIRKDGFKEVRKKMLLRSTPMMVIAVAGGITISTLNANREGQDVSTLPWMIAFFVLTVGYGLYAGIKRQKALFDSYSLTISETLIKREQHNTPSISIYFNEIKEIIKHKNGSFLIKGNTAADQIVIPTQIDDYAQIETLLQQIQPIVVKETVSWLEKYQSLTGLLTVGLMICVYTVDNKIIVGLAGSALVAFMGWSFLKIRSSKNIDNKTKNSAWWVLLVLFSVIAIMIFKLTKP